MVEFDYGKVVRDKTVVHCDTEDKANNLLTWADSKGLKWCHGKRFTSDSKYRAYNKYTCYCIGKGSYADTYHYQEEDYTILTYEEALMKEEKTFPRRMLVWNFDIKIKAERIVLGNFNGKFLAVDNGEEARFSEGEPYTTYTWDCAEELPTKKTRPMTHTEVFKAIRDGAVVRGSTSSLVINYWSTAYLAKDYELCRNYTGTDSDVWRKMEVEE